MSAGVHASVELTRAEEESLLEEFGLTPDTLACVKEQLKGTDDVNPHRHFANALVACGALDPDEADAWCERLEARMMSRAVER